MLCAFSRSLWLTKAERVRIDDKQLDAIGTDDLRAFAADLQAEASR
jgi:hypothetical protein